MDSDPGHVITIVHHDSESRMYVTGHPNPGSYLHQLTYAATVPQLTAMKTYVQSCRQHVLLECYAAAGTKDDFWVNIKGDRIPWHVAKDSGCQCSLSRACQDGRSR